MPVERALEHVFGLVLLNDWSARDIQAWEYRPLGPFLGKSFATSIGAWVAPLDALARTRARAAGARAARLPARGPVGVRPRPRGGAQRRRSIARSNARQLYWSRPSRSPTSTVSGASLRTGDLLGSGTISGPGRDERGSLLELSWNGEEPIKLADGATRTFLEDGDEVVLRGAGSARSAAALSAR